jgi:Uma2 family endonuclease
LNPATGADYFVGRLLPEVAVATHPHVLSADDVFDIPVPDELLWYELVDGQLVPVIPPSLRHGELVALVTTALRNHVHGHDLPGEVFTDAGFVLGLPNDPERMRGPDVMYVEHVNLEGRDLERVFRGIPDLAVEIDLTSGKKPHGQQRIVDYIEAGVRLVWAIDPYSRTATVYRSDGSARLLRVPQTLDGEDVVPGFRLELSELFG